MDPFDNVARDYMKRHPGTSFEMAAILVRQTARPKDSRPKDWGAAMQYMLDNPGVTGEQAFLAVRSGKGHIRADDPHAPPLGHADALSYIREHPGVTYEAALAHIADSPEPARPVADPHAAPQGHDEALAYIREHPGTTYEAALAAVNG